MDGEILRRVIAEREVVNLGPPPWDDAVLTQAFYWNFQKAREAIKSHPGYEYHRALEDITHSVELLRDSITRLYESCEDFRMGASDSSFWWRANIRTYETRVRNIRLSLFNSVCASLSLVDAYRAIKAKHPPGFTERTKVFASWGPHLFVQGLRNYVSHRRMIDPNWQTSILHDARETTFFLKQADLLEFDGWSDGAVEYIDQHSEGVEPERLFQEYREQVDDLFEWFVAEFSSHHSGPLSEYRRCLNLFNRLSTRDSHKLIINAVLSQQVDPYAYLHQYLNSEELDEVNKFPRHSKEQVNKIISIVDTYEACDDDLREKLYTLFRVAPPISEKNS